ncbi:hypothetical protein GUITHDRAFT_166892 [Guillardia theta CCMP2712]|uniref:Uncharacterized protein n=2 Tax=Guillardia theta TaxID=55529 RepID=L1I585_GUITC|nr:hypothetical protein GUITHDRAFT_166892 [Guillardia theta CCMP2712]EKX31386.1 hypothetical protein GUITHDRAFT_166892 [Guillardia theta CCMP2712]|mmetsp:Transcript_39935/g.125442  ORF Transcript_39935/g.125442 Transcript_39935/m.125442 type:complete len:308 (+) Transcript_39935:3-926(+)|eukprot:XP_005818366.1 hypothetical protein GUITHDRAFT_166892 [Guillardia theta CCMP2712]
MSYGTMALGGGAGGGGERTRRVDNRSRVFVALASVAAALLVVLVVLAPSRRTQLMAARTQSLGEEADWKPRSWSSSHVRTVMSQHLDDQTVKNIWQQPGEAWKGIDDILPTTGKYAYQENHDLNANEAKLLNYLQHARKRIHQIEKRLPEKLPSGKLGKEVEKMKVTMEAQDNGLYSIEQQLRHEKVIKAKAPSSMLSQTATPKASRRVFVDEAMYGEGIQGDIRSQGHKERSWSRKQAANDMNKYFNKLNKQILSKSGYKWSTTQKPGEMDRYFKFLNKRDNKIESQHKNILRREGYFQTHPDEAK